VIVSRTQQLHDQVLAKLPPIEL